MKMDRFKDFDRDVRDAVLRFEKGRDGAGTFFDVEELLMIIDYYLEVQDLEGLEAAVVCAEGLYPSNVEVKLRRAHLLSIEGRYTESMKMLQELEQTEPENTDVSYAKGAVYSMMDQSEKAIQCYLRAAADGYELDMIYGNVGDEYYKLGQRDKAIHYYRKAIAVNPDERRSLFNLACSLEENGEGDKGVDYLKEVVEQHPYSKWAWYSLGCLYEWRELYERAADAFEFAIAIDRTLGEAYEGLSKSYASLGQRGRAAQALRDWLEVADDRAYVLFCIGSLFFDDANYHTASVYFQKSLKEDACYSSAWRYLGLCSERLGYSDEAAGYYRRAIDVNPDNDINWLSLADLYISQNRFAEALSLLQSGRHEAECLSDFDMRLCYCLFRLGKREQVKEMINTPHEDDPMLYVDMLSYYTDMAADPEIAALVFQKYKNDEK